MNWMVALIGFLIAVGIYFYLLFKWAEPDYFSDQDEPEYKWYYFIFAGILPALVIVGSFTIADDWEQVEHWDYMNEDITVYENFEGKVIDIRLEESGFWNDVSQIILKTGEDNKSIVLNGMRNYGFNIGDNIVLKVSKSCSRRDENKIPDKWDYEGYRYLKD